MLFNTALTFSWLNLLTKKRYDALLQVYESLDEALSALDPALLKGLGCREETIINLMTRLGAFDPQAYAAALAKRGLDLLTIEDPDYPECLREMPDPPIFLYTRGDRALMDARGIGIVGTREMSNYGRRIVEMFVPDLVHAGLVTVSGLAFGIDAAVAEQTLAAGGRTVAVLGHGLGMIFPPEHRRLADTIVEGGGLLVSEFPLDLRPEKFTFPSRNRIIAALSRGTLVCEAGERSGALITAELALEYGRDVFAVPGPVFEPGAVGVHALIARGQARLVAHPREILQEWGFIVADEHHRTRITIEPKTPEEAAVLAALSAMPQTVTDVQQCTSLSIPSVNATLIMLELAGGARKLEDGSWIRR